MATGDIKNNLRKLQHQLRTVSYPNEVDIKSICTGTASAYLPIYHYVFLEYSKCFAALLVELNFEMFGKTDLRFVETVYKVLREVFAYKPPVTKDQFFVAGFAECKIIMCAQVIRLVQERHVKLGGSVDAKSSVKKSSIQLCASKNSITTINNQLTANIRVVSPILTNHQSNSVQVINKAVATAVAQLRTSSPTSSTSIVGIPSFHASGNCVAAFQPVHKASRIRNITSAAHDYLTGTTKSSNQEQMDCYNPSDVTNMSEKSAVGSRNAQLSELPKVSVIREDVFFGSEPKRTSVRDTTSSRLQSPPVVEHMWENSDGTDLNGAMSSGEDGKVDGSDEFLLDILSGVSQTMVQLVEKMNTMNERLSRLEASARHANKPDSCAIGGATHQVSDTNQYGVCKHCCNTVNGMVSDDVDNEHIVTVQPSTNENTSMMQNLTNIMARLTLLENSVSYLNNQQLRVSSDLDSSLDARIDREDMRQKTVRFDSSEILDAGGDGPYFRSLNSFVPDSLSTAHADRSSARADNASKTDPNLETSGSSSRSESPTDNRERSPDIRHGSLSTKSSFSPAQVPSSPFMRSRRMEQTERITALLRSTQAMLQRNSGNAKT